MPPQPMLNTTTGSFLISFDLSNFGAIPCLIGYNILGIHASNQESFSRNHLLPSGQRQVFKLNNPQSVLPKSRRPENQPPEITDGA